MPINTHKQSQFELFPSKKSISNPSELGKPGLMLKDLTLSPENIIVLCIICVMILVLSFSFGVERGKIIVKEPQALEQTGEVRVNLEAEAEAPLEAAGSKSIVVTTPAAGEKRQTLEIREEKFSIPEVEIIVGRQFTVQVASFRLEKNAKKEAEKLEEFGHDTFVMPKGKHSIVCIGKFSKHGDAAQFSSQLKNRYKDLLVRSL